MSTGTFIGLVIAVFITLGIRVFIGLIIEQDRDDKDRIGGVIHVDESDPDGPYFFLELNEDVDKMIRDGYLKVKVQIEHYASQE